MEKEIIPHFENFKMENDSDISYSRGQGFLDVPYITIPNLIKQHAERDPDAIAQIAVDWETYETEACTFNELYSCSLKFANGLLSLGVKKGDIVAIGTDNNIEWMISVIGTMICGAVCLLYSFDRKDGKDVEAVLSKVGGRCNIMLFPPGKNNMYLPIVENILKTNSMLGSVQCEASTFVEKAIVMSRTSNTKYLSMDDVIKMEETIHPHPPTDPDDIAAIFLTSGSTGLPKLIPLSHFAMLTTGFHFSIGYGVSKGKIYNDRVFSWVGGFPLWEITMGGTRVYLKHVSAIPTLKKYVDALQHVFSTELIDGSLLMAPVMPLIAQRDLAAWKLNNVSLGGRPISFATTKVLLPFCRRVSVLYGSTEALLNTDFVCENDKEYPDFICGKPFPGVEIKVVDNNGMSVKRGERGEAYVRSTVKFIGYFEDEEKTSAALTKNSWYRTGDSTVMMADGNIIAEGRMTDSLVGTGTGFIRFSVSYIESFLKQHHLIVDAEVVSLSYLKDQRCICCALILEEGAEMTDTELEEYLLDSKQHTVTFYRQVDASMKFVFLDHFPKTHNGKVNRKELARLCEEHLFGH